MKKRTSVPTLTAITSSFSSCRSAAYSLRAETDVEASDAEVRREQKSCAQDEIPLFAEEYAAGDLAALHADRVAAAEIA